MHVFCQTVKVTIYRLAQTSELQKLHLSIVSQPDILRVTNTTTTTINFCCIGQLFQSCYRLGQFWGTAVAGCYWPNAFLWFNISVKTTNS